MKLKRPKRIPQVNVPVSLPRELEREIVEVAKLTHLSKQDTMRQALFKGLPIVLAALTQPKTEEAHA